MDDTEYYHWFHYIVTSGIGCGLIHPIEWWLNAYRTPGGTLDDGYYQKIVQVAYRYFNDMFSSIHLKDPDAQSVREWLVSYYQEDHFFKRSFGAILVEAYEMKHNGS
jgi:hypothetical protein